MDSAASDYRERLNVITVETDNVNQRLERLYDALETGSLQLADLGTTDTAPQATPGATTCGTLGNGELAFR